MEIRRVLGTVAPPQVVHVPAPDPKDSDGVEETHERKHDHNIVYLGLTTAEGPEKRALGKHVTAVPHSAVGTVVHGGRRYALETDAGRLAFAAELMPDADKQERLASLLSQQFSTGRDELASLAALFSRAESGAFRFDRLVLSGHSGGNYMWGDRGMVQLSAVRELVGLFPRAADGVKHLMLSACQTGHETQIDAWRAVFPKLDSVWAYDGKAPSTYATADLERFRELTLLDRPIWRREAPSATADFDNDKTPDYSVAIWSRGIGYQGSYPARPLADDEADVARLRPTVESYSADRVTGNADEELRAYYDALQRLFNRQDLLRARRDELDEELRRVLLLRHPEGRL